MGFKDKMKDAAALAAVQARKAAEQAKDLAADVREQAQEKWAEEQQRRAVEDPRSPAAASTATDPGGPATPETPNAPISDGSATTATSSPIPATPSTPSLRAKMTDTAARASVQARKSVEEAKGRRTSLTGQMRDHAPAALPQRLDLTKNKKALVALAGLVLVAIGGLSVAAIAENDDKNANASAPTSESPTTTPTPTPTPTPVTATPAAAPVVDTTVDALLDKLNTEPIDGPGAGPQTGDRFRITGPLFEADAWGPTASGDYAVMFKAKGGADDLQVLVAESDAAKWANGTKVEMVVELVEVTIDGEKLNGFLRAVSVRTLAGGVPPKAQSADTSAQMFKDLDRFADTFNTAFGDPPMITSIEPGSAPGVVYVNLHPGLLGVDVDVAQQAVSTMNEQLVETIGDNDSFSGMVKYFIGNQLVGENHAILDPYSVSFKGGLDD